MNREQIKELVTEAVLNFLNEAKHWPPGKHDEFWPDNTENNDDEFNVKMNGPEYGGTNLSPWINDKSKEEPKAKIHPMFTKNSGSINSFGLNEKEN